MHTRLFLTFSIALFTVCPAAQSQDVAWSAQQNEIIEAINTLSAATAPGGKGADAYARMLDPQFSRWTLGGEALSRKSAWVEGLREWFDEGWRVIDRDVTFVEIWVQGELAFTRRTVAETYSGPDGEQSTSSASLAEVWKKSTEGWRLFRVDLQPH